VDGTLSDTDDQWAAVFEQRLVIFRRLFPKDQMRSFVRWALMCAESPGNLVYNLLDRANLDDEVGQVYNYLSRHAVGRKPAKFLVIEGVCDAVLSLRQRYPLAVVSARDRAGTLAFLRQYQLEEYFPVIATAMTCTHTKPFPDPILWAAGQMGVPPENCLMVGDTTVDIRAGRAAGAQTVGVLCGFGKEKELLRAGADLILPATSALAPLLLA
jgi:HAD superfamily hydrolase (TIGR01509 family)